MPLRGNEEAIRYGLFTFHRWPLLSERGQSVSTKSYSFSDALKTILKLDLFRFIGIKYDFGILLYIIT